MAQKVSLCVGKMKQRKPKKKTRKRLKTPIARTPVAVEVYKKRFLHELARGYTPTVAAERVYLARCTTYKWKKEDDKFAEDWEDAIQQGLDRVENGVYQRALKKGSSLDAHFILKHRRRDIYGNIDDSSRTSLTLNITLAEHNKRLERLGLPVPQIESDLVDEELVPNSLEQRG